MAIKVLKELSFVVGCDCCKRDDEIFTKAQHHKAVRMERVILLKLMGVALSNQLGFLGLRRSRVSRNRRRI